MTALQQLLERHGQEQEVEEKINHVALLHALDEEIGQKLLAEAVVEIPERSRGGYALLTFSGFLPVMACHEPNRDGIGWALTFTVHDGTKMRKCREVRLAHALVPC
jgi:hypothetical protein